MLLPRAAAILSLPSLTFSALVLAFGLPGCGSGRAPSVAAGNLGAASIAVSPSRVALTAVGQTSTVHVSEAGYTGVFSVMNSDASVISTTQTDAADYTVTALAAGSANLTFHDLFAQTASVQVGVTTSGIVIGARPKDRIK